MSVAMKCSEGLVLRHIKGITDPNMDPLQFVYQANRSVEDTINLGLHILLQHLDSLNSYTRNLFLD